MALAIVIILLVVGSVLFHILSPWWFTPIASNWGTMDTTVDLTFWVTGIVFILLNLFMAYAVIKYRHREDSRAHYEPENKKLEGWLIGITSIGVIAMLAPGLFVWADFVNVPDEATEVEVVGQQWRWSFRYPGDDGALGSTDVRHISEANPFGINPNDPAGQDDILINGPSLRLPVDVPVKLLLRSKDVLHNFTVPQFRSKMDMVPGMVTFLWLTPTRTGEYDILCEELCGVGHFAMRGRVVVEEAGDYQSWLSQQPTFAETMEHTGNPSRGQALYTPCAACHGQQGEGNINLNAPKLSGLNPWYLERQLKHFKNDMRGGNPDDSYGLQMVQMVATLPDDQAIRDVSAYIDTLEDKPAETTVTGDTTNGRRLYRSCANCHGAEGQGVWSTNAPRLAGMSDWYLVRQLQNYKAGARGYHPADASGKQMAMLTGMLTSDESIHDVISYVNKLP